MIIYKIDFSVHNISLNFARCVGKIFIKYHQQETVWPRRWFSNLFKCYKFTSGQFYQHDCARHFLCEDSLVFKSSLTAPTLKLKFSRTFLFKNLARFCQIFCNPKNIENANEKATQRCWWNWLQFADSSSFAAGRKDAFFKKTEKCSFVKFHF